LGGGQERGLRSGTENTALIAGFAKSLEIADRDREGESIRLGELKSCFLDKVKESFPDAVINSESPSLPNIVSISFPGVLSEMLLLRLEMKGILVSTGSSCSTNGEVSGSPVIRALNKPELAESTLRISMGRFTEKKDVDVLIRGLEDAIAHDRMSA
jgi:cysteine desulfurase